MGLFQEALRRIPDLCTCGHPDVTAPPQTGCCGHQAAGGDRRLALLRSSRQQSPARNSSLTGNGKQSRTRESGQFSLP